jgi:signal transduction histidine kinase
VGTRILFLEKNAEFAEIWPRRRKEDAPGMDFTLRRAGGAPIISLPGEADSAIRIEIEDTGPGIPQEELGKIFDPFYTTKPAGEGTGLGLAICVRILESYGGRLQVRSEVGKGTIFTILLPIF